MRTRIAALALTAGIATTGVLVGPALAQDATTSTSPSATTTERAAARVTAIKDALAGLVSDGTLDQAQADRVATTLSTSDALRGRHGGHGGRGAGHVPVEAVAQVLGITVDELRAQQQAGRTLTQIADAEGISKADLVSRLVAAADAAQRRRRRRSPDPGAGRREGRRPRGEDHREGRPGPHRSRQPPRRRALDDRDALAHVVAAGTENTSGWSGSRRTAERRDPCVTGCSRGAHGHNGRSTASQPTVTLAAPASLVRGGTVNELSRTAVVCTVATVALLAASASAAAAPSCVGGSLTYRGANGFVQAEYGLKNLGASFAAQAKELGGIGQEQSTNTRLLIGDCR